MIIYTNSERPSCLDGQMQIEGLQTLKPQILDCDESVQDRRSPTGKEGASGWNPFDSADESEMGPLRTRLQPVNVHVTSKSGLDFAANLIENTEDHDDSGAHWVVESVKVAVKEPVSSSHHAPGLGFPEFCFTWRECVFLLLLFTFNSDNYRT